MQEDSVQAGITGEPAPELGVTQWIDAAGQPLADYGLDKMRGKFKLVFCFQDACPGCHLTGFPSLVRVVEAFRGSPFVSFAAVQTVFEDFESNTVDRVAANQRKYALPIPFGHDAGAGHVGDGSVLMQRYRNGGTPWFILVDPSGAVVYNYFRIDVEKLIAELKRAESAPPVPTPDAGTITWRDVIQHA